MPLVRFPFFFSTFNLSRNLMYGNHPLLSRCGVSRLVIQPCASAPVTWGPGGLWREARAYRVLWVLLWLLGVSVCSATYWGNGVSYSTVGAGTWYIGRQRSGGVTDGAPSGWCLASGSGANGGDCYGSQPSTDPGVVSAWYASVDNVHFYGPIGSCGDEPYGTGYVAQVILTFNPSQGATNMSAAIAAAVSSFALRTTNAVFGSITLTNALSYGTYLYAQVWNAANQAWGGSGTPHYLNPGQSLTVSLAAGASMYEVCDVGPITNLAQLNATDLLYDAPSCGVPNVTTNFTWTSAGGSTAGVNGVQTPSTMGNTNPVAVIGSVGGATTVSSGSLTNWNTNSGAANLFGISPSSGNSGGSSGSLSNFVTVSTTNLTDVGELTNIWSGVTNLAAVGTSQSATLSNLLFNATNQLQYLSILTNYAAGQSTNQAASLSNGVASVSALSALTNLASVAGSNNLASLSNSAAMSFNLAALTNLMGREVANSGAAASNSAAAASDLSILTNLMAQEVANSGAVLSNFEAAAAVLSNYAAAGGVSWTSNRDYGVNTASNAFASGIGSAPFGLTNLYGVLAGVPTGVPGVSNISWSFPGVVLGGDGGGSGMSRSRVSSTGVTIGASSGSLVLDMSGILYGVATGPLCAVAKSFVTIGIYAWFFWYVLGTVRQYYEHAGVVSQARTAGQEVMAANLNMASALAMAGFITAIIFTGFSMLVAMACGSILDGLVAYNSGADYITSGFSGLAWGPFVWQCVLQVFPAAAVGGVLVARVAMELASMLYSFIATITIKIMVGL